MENDAPLTRGFQCDIRNLHHQRGLRAQLLHARAGRDWAHTAQLCPRDRPEYEVREHRASKGCPSMETVGPDIPRMRPSLRRGDTTLNTVPFRVHMACPGYPGRLGQQSASDSSLQSWPAWMLLGFGYA